MTATLHHARGEEPAAVGDRFRWHDGRSYEIAAFTDGRTYSPSGFGGTPTVLVRQVGGEPDPHMQQYTDDDGLIEWCGDSVGAGLAFGRLPIHVDGGGAA